MGWFGWVFVVEDDAKVDLQVVGQHSRFTSRLVVNSFENVIPALKGGASFVLLLLVVHFYFFCETY